MEGVDGAMANRLAKSTAKVQQWLGLGAEFILMRLAEITAVEQRKIGIRVDGSQDESAIGMQDATPFTESCER